MTFQADLINFIKARPELAEYNELFNEYDAALEQFQETWAGAVVDGLDNTPEYNAAEFALEAMSDGLCEACADLITGFHEDGLNVWSYCGEGSCWEIDLVTTEIDYRTGRPVEVKVTLCGKNYTP